MKLIQKKSFPFANYTFIELDVIKLVLLKIMCLYIPFIVVLSKKAYFIPDKDMARTYFWFIFMRTDMIGDYSILTHEVVHIRQSISSFGLHIILYNFSDSYRYKSEIEAYAYQCIHLIFYTNIGYNSLVIDEILLWISDILVVDKGFSENLKKDKTLIKKDITKLLVKLLKECKESSDMK